MKKSSKSVWSRFVMTFAAAFLLLLEAQIQKIRTVVTCKRHLSFTRYFTEIGRKNRKN